MSYKAMQILSQKDKNINNLSRGSKPVLSKLAATRLSRSSNLKNWLEKWKSLFPRFLPRLKSSLKIIQKCIRNVWGELSEARSTVILQPYAPQFCNHMHRNFETVFAILWPYALATGHPSGIQSALALRPKACGGPFQPQARISQHRSEMVTVCAVILWTYAP